MSYIKSFFLFIYSIVCFFGRLISEVLIVILESRIIKFLSGQYFSDEQKYILKMTYYGTLLCVQIGFFYCYIWEVGIPKITTIENAEFLSTWEGFIHGYSAALSFILSFFIDNISPVLLHQGVDYYYGVGFGAWFFAAFCHNTSKRSE